MFANPSHAAPRQAETDALVGEQFCGKVIAAAAEGRIVYLAGSINVAIAEPALGSTRTASSSVDLARA